MNNYIICRYNKTLKNSSFTSEFLLNTVKGKCAL